MLLLYVRSLRVMGKFERLCHQLAGSQNKVRIGNLKAFPRVIEKTVLRPKAGVPWDMLRGQIEGDTMRDVADVLRRFLDTNFAVAGINDRFMNSKGGWADVSIYITFPECAGVVAELQVVNRDLVHVRETMKAHDAYDDSRFCAEIKRKKTDEVSKGLPWSQQ